MNIKITLPRIDYNLDYVDEILKIDENKYKLLNVGEIEVSTKHLPSAIDTGEIFVYFKLLLDEINNNTVFINLVSSALYDLYKFLISKMKTFLKGNKHEQDVIGVSVHGRIVDENNESINFDLRCSSENVIEIMDKFSKIKCFLENNKYKTVNIHYDHQTDEWIINNKCDNNILR